MAFRLKLVWITALALSVGVGCTLVAEVDRSKIGAGGAGGESSSSDGE